MFPYLLQTSSVTIGSYGVLLAIAYLTGRQLYINNLELMIKKSINSELLIISLLVFGVIGAKLMFVLKNPQIVSFSDWSSLTAGSGFSSQGAIMAAILVTLIFAKLNRLKLHQLLDAAAFPAITAYAIARIGCFLAGDDCWGTDSNLPWAMSFPDGIKPTRIGQTVHPLPLYEVFYSLVIGFYLYQKQQKQFAPYSLFFSLFLFWGACRFFIEFISTNPIKIYFMSGSQFGALIMFFTGLAFLLLQTFHRDKKKPGS